MSFAKTLILSTLIALGSATAARAETTPASTAAPAAVPAPDAPKQVIDWSARITFPTTEQVRDACVSPNVSDQAFCYGEIRSAYDSDLYFADAMATHPQCIPENTTVEQVRQGFLKVVKGRPMQLSGNFSIFFYAAMDIVFPCNADGLPMGSAPVPHAAAPASTGVEMTTPDPSSLKSHK